MYMQMYIWQVSFRRARRGVGPRNSVHREIIEIGPSSSAKPHPPGNLGGFELKENGPAMRLLVSLLVWFLGAVVTSRGSLALENLALRQQLATYARLQQRPRLKPEARVFWGALSRIWEGWRSPLVLVKPATVIAWHRRGLQRYWRHKSGKPGRPRIPAGQIAFIRRIRAEQPGWGEDRIAEELAIKLGVHHSTSTIRRYMVRQREAQGRSDLQDASQQPRKPDLRGGLHTRVFTTARVHPKRCTRSCNRIPTCRSRRP